MSRKTPVPYTEGPSKRRRYTKEFRHEAVQMLLDGYMASSVSERLGLSGPNILYRWKALELDRFGPMASTQEDRVRQLEAELLRVTRERDVLKKAPAISGRNE